MANTSQAPDLEGLHREMHGIAEQIRIMNENNARLIQHLSRKFNDLIALAIQAMMILKITKVLAGHIYIGIDDTDHQVLTPS